LADQISFSQDGTPLLADPLTRWWTAIALTFLWGCHQLMHELPLKTIFVALRPQWLVSIITLFVIWAVLYWANPTFTLEQNTIHLLPTEPVHRLWLIFVSTMLWGIYNLSLQLPRILLIGSGNSGNTALLEKLAEILAHGKLSDISQKEIDGSSSRLEQFFGEKTVWVSVPGKFQQKLNRVNALVITISVEELNASDYPLEAIIDKLYQRSGLILPVYLMITKMDRIVGFTEFFSPESPLGLNLYTRLKTASKEQCLEILDKRFGALQKNIEEYALTAPDQLTEEIHFRRLVLVGEWKILQSQLQKWISTHLDLDKTHLCGIYFTSAKQSNALLESPYLNQLADKLGICAPSITPFTNQRAFIKNAFDQIDEDITHHRPQKLPKPKNTLKIIAFFSVTLVAAGVILWHVLPRPKITFGILTPENSLQEQVKVFYGTELKLKWQVQHATETQLVIHPKSMPIENSGIKKLSADKPMTATLMATDYYLFNLPVKFFSFTEEKTITINLLPPKVTCISLDGECLVQDHHNPNNPVKASQEICYGSEKTLSWEVVGAKSVTPHFQGSQPSNLEPPVTLSVEMPTTFTLKATNGVDTVETELDLALSSPKIDCLAVNGQCVESVNDLCFGETLNVQVDGSCYQSLITQVDQAETINETEFSLMPEKPTQLSVVASNGMSEIKKELEIDFKPPLIQTFCGPGKMVAHGSIHPFNWETSCSAKVILKPVVENAPISTSLDTEGETSLKIESTSYALTAYNHLGENAQIVQQVMDIKLAPADLVPVNLADRAEHSFLIQRHEVTQKEYQACDTCEQLSDQIYDNLYCIHDIDWDNKLILGQQGNSPKAIVCLNYEQAEELLEEEDFEEFSYEPLLDSLPISEQTLSQDCWLSLANSVVFGLPGGRLQQENLPAVCVSWKDAVTYANWKSQQQGFSPCYDESFKLQASCDGYRLPKNQEWQWAALGIESQEQWFPWGKARLDCQKLGLQPDCDLPLPRDVESNAQDLSPLGVKDMGLSVSEWVDNHEDDVAIARGLNYTTFWPLFTDDMRFDKYLDQNENYSLEDRVSTIGFRLVQRLVESPDETGKALQCVRTYP